jgi:hypothetical protein
MKNFNCIVRIEFTQNQASAKNKKDYIDQLKQDFLDEYNLEICENDIFEIQEFDDLGFELE